MQESETLFATRQASEPDTNISYFFHAIREADCHRSKYFRDRNFLRISNRISYFINFGKLGLLISPPLGFPTSFTIVSAIPRRA